MRAWMDGTDAHVTVFAMKPAAGADEREERFVTLVLTRGGARVITSTDMYGAAPIMVEATP
jgi:hypothetical protein